MIERLKNVSFPVKCGLAILIFPIEGMVVAYLSLYIMGLTRPMGGWEMEPLLPLVLLYFVSFPFFLLFMPRDQSWQELPPTSLKYFFYKHFILIISPLALIPWFVLGYLIGKLASRFSPKIQKFTLFFFIAAPTALFLLPLLMMVPLVLLGILLSNFRFFALVSAGILLMIIWLMVKWIRRRNEKVS